MKNKKTTINETISYTRKMTRGLSNAQRNEILAEAIHPYVYRKIKPICESNPMATRYIRENFGTVSNVSRYIAQEINENKRTLNEVWWAMGLSGLAGNLVGKWLGNKIGKLFGNNSSASVDDVLKNLDTLSASELAQLFSAFVPDGYNSSKWEQACSSTASSTQLKPGDGFAKSFLLEVISAYRNSDNSQEQDNSNDPVTTTDPTTTDPTTTDPTTTDPTATDDSNNQQNDNQQTNPIKWSNAPGADGFIRRCNYYKKRNDGTGLVELFKDAPSESFGCAMTSRWPFEPNDSFQNYQGADIKNLLKNGGVIYSRNIDQKFQNINQSDYKVN